MDPAVRRMWIEGHPRVVVVVGVVMIIEYRTRTADSEIRR